MAILSTRLLVNGAGGGGGGGEGGGDRTQVWHNNFFKSIFTNARADEDFKM